MTDKQKQSLLAHYKAGLKLKPLVVQYNITHSRITQIIKSMVGEHKFQKIKERRRKINYDARYNAQKEKTNKRYAEDLMFRRNRLKYAKDYREKLKNNLCQNKLLKKTSDKGIKKKCPK